jgi:uncharacterized membrane protein
VGGADSLLDRGGLYKRDDSEFDRAIGFVDATYALALTLLVTTLDVDDLPTSWSSPEALFDAVGAQFIAFAIAFAVIANYWVVHHRMIAAFGAIDYPTIVANLFLIGAIVLLPFSTQSVGDPSVDDLALPTAVMAANVAAASILHALVFGLGARRGLLEPPRPTGEVRGYLLLSLLPAVVFLASIPLAYAASPGLARLSWIALIPLNLIAGKLALDAAARAQSSRK